MDNLIHLPDPTKARAWRETATLQQRVYDHLARSLMVGAFIPGQAVTLRSLAHRLGTSPMPVRQAINRLITERALEMLPNGSVIVPRITRAAFTEVSMLRCMLEGIAAEEACGRADTQVVSQLEAINEDLLEAVEQRDLPRVLVRNQQFHFALYEVSQYQATLSMIRSLWLQSGPFMYFSQSAPAAQWNTSQHKEALSALAARNPASVRRAIELDIQTTANYLLETVDFQDSRRADHEL